MYWKLMKSIKIHQLEVLNLTMMKRIYILIVALFVGIFVQAQTNPTPQALPYSQNFSSFTGATAAYPAGWQGWTIAGSTSTAFPTAAPSGDQVIASGVTAQNSAVSSFVGDAVGKIAFLSTSAAMKSFVLSVNTTSVTGVQVSYVAATQRQQLANRIGAMGLQYRVGNTGTFTDVASSEYQNPGGSDNITGTGSISPQTITVTLPAACDNQAEVQLRWVYREVSGAGNRPGFSVTNVTVGTGSVTPTLTAGTVADFGNIVILNNSTSQSFNISGTNLTGAPGNITITAPSTDFQVSNNNSTWLSSTTIVYATATLAATPVYVRFTPQTVGLKSGNLAITGGGVASAVNVAVSGTGIASAIPSLSTTSLATFGNVCTNTVAGPNSFTINGTDLNTTAVQVAALSGYTYSTTLAGTYTSTLTIPQAGGIFSQVVYVQFNPTLVQSYNGSIAVSGAGAAAINVAATGAGVNTLPGLTTGVASAITISSATTAGTIVSNGCTTVTAYGIEYSTTNGFANGTGTQVTSTNLSAGNFTANLAGLAASTTYYYKAYATNGGGTGYGSQQSFTTLSPVLSSTAPTAFGSICLNTSSAANSFTLTGTNLNTSNINIGPLAGFSFSSTSTGIFTASLSIPQTGGSFSQQIFVKFTPVTVISYTSPIPVNGGGANSISIPVSGTGINSPGIASTGSAIVLSPNTASLSGLVAAIGCSPITSYGIEYSGINGFVSGTGTRIASSNINGSAVFSASVTGLVQNTVYYFKAYVVNNGGISYGAQQSFTTKSIPYGLTVYNTPILRGGSLHYTYYNIKPGHYFAQIFNSNGQLVFQRDLLVQLNFIDETFTLPAKLGIGPYTLQVGTIDKHMKKRFMIN